MSIETIKVKPWGEGQGEFVIINADDFDPSVHKPYDPAAAGSSVSSETPAHPKSAAKRKKG